MEARGLALSFNFSLQERDNKSFEFCSISKKKLRQSYQNKAKFESFFLTKKFQNEFFLKYIFYRVCG